MLSDKGIKLICLDLPVKDLSSSEGKLMLQMFSAFSAFAEFERNRIRERTNEGLQRAKSEGKKLGRPQAIGTTKKVLACKDKGMTQTQVANELSISLPTVKRHWRR
jgi:DNA invertase Pin-like site-specific DNA recombinase